jgi:nickel-dependent lactate racemase
MKIDLHYGNGIISLAIPGGNIANFIRPGNYETKTDNKAVVEQALGDDKPSDFSARVDGKRVCVLVADGTRDTPTAEILSALLKMLTKALSVQFLVCTGTHNAQTPENSLIAEGIEAACKAAGAGQFEIHIHNCQEDELVNAGTTCLGTEIKYNALAKDADIFVVLSDIKSHYFAGYSNPVKNFVPGICGFVTAENNHGLALDERSTFGIHPWHFDEKRRDNPLACDQLEGMKLITGDRKVYAIETITASGQIHWAGFGLAETISGEAFARADELNSFTLRPTDRLIVSPGGLPNDIDLYIAQRALELTKAAVNDNGEVLFLAACTKGIGEEHTMENFYNRLRRDIDEILASAKNEYKLFSHKPYKFAQMIQRLRRIWVHSEIENELIEAAHLWPTDDPQKVVDDWLSEDVNTRITIVDGANKVALYAE